MTVFDLCGEKIGHVGVVVPDRDAAVKRAYHEFGIGPWRLDENPDTVPTWHYGEPTKNPQKLAFASWGDLQIEMIEPLPEADSACQDFLKMTGGKGGIHHIGFITESLEEMEELAQRLRDQGYAESLLAREVGLAGDGDAYFFDTQETLGFILEVAAPITITQEMVDREQWYPAKPE